jgi:hypothetical protein
MKIECSKIGVLSVALLIAGLAHSQSKQQEKDPPYTKEWANYRRGLRPPATGAYVQRTKGGVKYVIYTPMDEFHSTQTDQWRLWWVTIPWDGDDRPYLKVRQGIEARIKNGEKPLTLAAAFQKELKADPWDSLKVFRWAYASWMACKTAKDGNEAQKIISPVGEYMPHAPFPRTVQYARLSFLVQARTHPRFALKHVGDALLKRFPKDEAVKLAMVRVLTAGKPKVMDVGRIYDPRDDKRALAILDFFRKKYPDNQGYEAEYAKTMQYFWERQHPADKTKAQRAIAAYEGYLRKFPDTPSKAWANYQMKRIRLRQHDWETWEEKNWRKEMARIRAKRQQENKR